MDDKIKVFFIGGLTNGKIVNDYLKSNRYVDLCGVITYPDDFSGARHIPFEDGDNVIKSGSVIESKEAIFKSQPDMIIVTGWSELVPDDVLKYPNMGVYGFHPAKLPLDRGRSVLAWQIEDGYKETALTMFRYTDYPDGGDIAAQELIKISKDDYITDILDKIDKATKNIIKAYFPLIRKGLLNLKKQDLTVGNFRRLRNAEDSKIKWNSDSEDIYNKIRAISHPYPGATGELFGKQYLIWRSELLERFPFGNEEKPGTIIAKLYDESVVVKTRDSFIRVTEYNLL